MHVTVFCPIKDGGRSLKQWVRVGLEPVLVILIGTISLYVTDASDYAIPTPRNMTYSVYVKSSVNYSVFIKSKYTKRVFETSLVKCAPLERAVRSASVWHKRSASLKQTFLKSFICHERSVVSFTGTSQAKCSSWQELIKAFSFFKAYSEMPSFVAVLGKSPPLEKVK